MHQGHWVVRHANRDQVFHLARERAIHFILDCPNVLVTRRVLANPITGIVLLPRYWPGE
jgi:hypothetical protein